MRAAVRRYGRPSTAHTVDALRGAVRACNSGDAPPMLHLLSRDRVLAPMDRPTARDGSSTDFREALARKVAEARYFLGRMHEVSSSGMEFTEELLQNFSAFLNAGYTACEATKRGDLAGFKRWEEGQDAASRERFRSLFEEHRGDEVHGPGADVRRQRRRTPWVAVRHRFGDRHPARMPSFFSPLSFPGQVGPTATVDVITLGENPESLLETCQAGMRTLEDMESSVFR